MHDGSQSRADAPRALIVGGGLGGLAAALALRSAGVQAVVYERAKTKAAFQAGGGYTIWYAGIRALQSLGLGEKVHGAGQLLERFEFTTKRARRLALFEIGERGRQLGSPPVGILRTALHSILLEAVGEQAIRLDSRCAGFEQDADGVTARFEDGRKERGDLLVGADGLDSAVRAQLSGTASPARYPGYGHWFGFTEAERGLVSPPTFRIMFDRGKRFGLLPVGQGRLCWWCTRPAAEGGRRVEPGVKAELQRLYGDWAPPVKAVMEATKESEIGRRDTYDREPIEQWGMGRVTLLGDAAHAMTFDLGLGASTTLKDAVMLGKAFQASKDVVTALRSYEAIRRPRANYLVGRSRKVGEYAAWASPLAARVNQAVLAVGRYTFIPKEYERDLDFTFRPTP
jgi:2-polyprenyl-6-methoxyphenol hydroxylase-like FAD-dependent oxidoreductase